MKLRVENKKIKNNETGLYVWAEGESGEIGVGSWEMGFRMIIVEMTLRKVVDCVDGVLMRSIGPQETLLFGRQRVRSCCYGGGFFFSLFVFLFPFFFPFFLR